MTGGRRKQCGEGKRVKKVFLVFWCFAVKILGRGQARAWHFRARGAKVPGNLLASLERDAERAVPIL